MKKNHPWSQRELDNWGREFSDSLYHRVVKHRRHGDIKSMQTDAWDIPHVAVACSSTVAPFIGERGKNCSDLRSPHPTLFASYPSNRHEPNMPTYPGEPHYSEGHCAEPHVAHQLLNQMDKAGQPIKIADIHFGKAFSVKNDTVKPACATCKQTFLQLR